MASELHDLHAMSAPADTGSRIDTSHALGAGRVRGRPGAGLFRVLLGLFLLSTAALKFHAVAFEPPRANMFAASPRLQLAAAEAETVLGLLLLFGWVPRVTWVGAVGFFIAAGGVSLYRALDGQASCGCFGSATVSPWIAFAGDALILAGLAFWRPAGVGQAFRSARLRPYLIVAAGAALLLVASGVGLTLACGGLSRGLAFVRGEPIVVQPGVAEVQEGRAGEERAVAVQVVNFGDRPTQIIGGSATCSCVATRDLPVTVDAGEAVSIRVKVTLRETPGRFEHPFLLYTDDGKQPVVTARFAGRVLPGE
jgi:hypothetical protein